jgi:hypothetical protein
MTLTHPTILPHKDDNRGAIMVIGIFMACAMIALMWYMIGLGDSLIWRDRSQEAADSIAFSSAAIHAHGMNIIAFINIVMSILVAIYLLAAIVYNLTDFLLLLTGRTDDWCFFAQIVFDPWPNLENSCQVRDDIKKLIELVLAFFTGGATAEDIGNNEFCDAAGILQAIHDPLADDLGSCPSASPGHLINKYEQNILGPVNYWGAKLQVQVAKLAPVVGAVMGTYVAYDGYTDHTDANAQHKYGTAISPSMMPTSAGDGYSLSEAQRSMDWLQPSGDPRLGLPVGTMRMGYLCYRDAAYAPKWLMSKMTFLANMPIIGQVFNWLIKKLANSIESWYCANDSEGVPLFKTASDLLYYLSIPIFPFGNFWYDLQERVPPYAFDYKGNPFWNSEKTGGPKVMVEYAQNGNDWMQVWGVVLPFNRKELNDSEHRVGFTQGKGGGKAVSYKESQNSRDLYTEGKNVYYSAAEFYLNKDCAWDDFDCNSSAADNLNNATFSMKWRSRLRRVHSPAWGGAMLNWLKLDFTTNAKLLQVMDFIHTYLLDDPQAKYTTAFKALKDGENHKAKAYLEDKSLVPDIFH